MTLISRLMIDRKISKIGLRLVAPTQCGLIWMTPGGKKFYLEKGILTTHHRAGQPLFATETGARRIKAIRMISI